MSVDGYIDQSSSGTGGESRSVDLRRSLRRFFANTRVEAAIGVLILISVTLTLGEMVMTPSSPWFTTIAWLNWMITVIFAIELTLRFVAASLDEQFVGPYMRRWWIDMLAVFPALILVPGLALLRGFRILRFVRLLRFGRLFSSAPRFLPYVVREGAFHFVYVGGALLAIVMVGTALILSLERVSNPDIATIWDAFWFSLYSIFAGEPIPGPPETAAGRIASVIMMFAGILVIAAFIGTVSALMVDRLQREGRKMRLDKEMENHVILCGLGQVGYRVLEVLVRLNQPVVVLESDPDAEFIERAKDLGADVHVEDVRRPGVFHDAGIDRARAVIACTDNDLTNLEIALDARQARADIRVVLRLFDQRLAGKVAEGFNIQVAFSPATLAAPSFAASAIDRSVLGSIDVGGRVFIYSDFDVPTESSLPGKTVSELRDGYEIHTLLCRDVDGVEHTSPAHDFAVPSGGSIAVVGPFDQVARLKEECGVTLDLVRAANSEEPRH
jgi:Trk K+ transport system NAD-binding subunit